MDRAFAMIAVVATAFVLIASAERPAVGWQTVASTTTATPKLALPPAGNHQQPAAADEDAATIAAGEWLPFVAARHLPAASSPLPWAVSEAEAGEPELKERQQPSHVGDGRTTNNPEQLAMEESTGWLQAPAPAPGASNVGSDEAAKMMADTVDEEAELPELLNPDEPWLKNHCLVDRHDFNRGSREYNHLMWRVNFCLIKFTSRRSSDHWVLCPEPNDPNDAPCGYVIVPLRGLNGHECALALRADNLDIAAFANGRNTWHVFKRYAHLIPTATVLDFDNNYQALIGRGDEAKMMRVLSGTYLLQCVSVISLHMKAPGIDEAYIKEALGTMAMGIPEAKRFTPIREVIISGWLQRIRLSEVLAKYLSRWRELSCALMVTEKTGAWGDDEYSKSLVDIVMSRQEALNIVAVLHDCPFQ